MASTFFKVNAVVAGETVEWIYEDTETKGDWLGFFNPVGNPWCEDYGYYAHILPNAPTTRVEVPIGEFSAPIALGFDLGDNSTWHLLEDPPYSWHWNQITGLPFYANFTSRCLNPPYWDEYVSLSPKVTYYVNGTYIVADDVQYPVFEFAFEDWHATQTEPREVYYTTHIDDVGGPGWRLVSWDDGGERCKPEFGYMNFTIYIPEGTYYLSLYAYDYAYTARESQEYRIYDETGTTLLASKGISGSVFDDGVYEIFKVVAPSGGLTIILQVYNDAGHVVTASPPSQSSNVVPNYPPGKSNNVVLSGIFVDKVHELGGVVGGIWSSDSSGSLKDVFYITEKVYVTVPATGETVDLYVVADKGVWSYGDLITPVFSKVEGVILATDDVDTIEIWGDPLIGSYDIIMDTNRDGYYNDGDHIDACNVQTGFFVIPEFAFGTIAAILSCVAALAIFKGKRKKIINL